jgi:ABC-type lipoprotein export system ATPase subunit
MIRTTGLTFSFGAGSTFRFPDIEVESGAIGILKGPSGTGKTTLLQILAGQLPPNTGTLEISQTVSFMPQRPRLIPSLKLMDNLMLTPNADAEHVRQLAHQLELDGKLSRYPSELSEGERQRADLVRALSNHPNTLLADEPTAALDDGNAETWCALIQQHCGQSGISVFVATHDTRIQTLVGTRNLYMMR